MVTPVNQFITAVSQNNGGGNNNPNPSHGKRQRVARQISGSLTQTSESTSSRSGLFQDIEVSCTQKTEISTTTCAVTLHLNRAVPPCCILSTLSAASSNSPDVQAVGERADRTSPLQNECSAEEEHGCSLCEESGTPYVAPQSSTTQCGAALNASTQQTTQNVETGSCNCSAYCSQTDAYYNFNISIQDPKTDLEHVLELIAQLRPPNCSPTTDSCSPSTIGSAYKDVIGICGSDPSNPQLCSIILGLSHEVSIRRVSVAVTSLLHLKDDIGFDGRVVRVAMCGNGLQSGFAWAAVKTKPAKFCALIEDNNEILTCKKGESVLVLLDEEYLHEPLTTPAPNTTSSVNATSPPLNTTAVTNASVPLTTESAESRANGLLALSGDVANLNSSQVSQLVSQLEDLLTGPTVSMALGNTSVHIVSNLLGASAETLAESSDRIIGIVDTVALKLVLHQEAETLLSPAVALSVKQADGSNFQETVFSISDPDDVEVRGDPRIRRSMRRDSSVPQGSIRLPPSLTQDLTSEQQQQASRVQFNFYQQSTVFQDPSMGSRKLNSGILGASVANLSIKGLQDDIVIHLRHLEPIPGNFEPTCVFWDLAVNDKSGGWNPDGCYVRNRTDNETICGCNHLTSFAILLDLSREPITSRLQATILTFITFIGCGISAIFLSITLLTYLAFGKLRKDIPSKILIQLCVALLLLNLVFLVDAWLALYPEAVGLCISTAWFLHYFLLVSFTWMGLEAVHMYLALVKVFNTYISRYMLKFSLVGWGVPMIVVIIVIAIDKDNYGLISYGRFSDGTSDEFCWLRNDVAFYVAVVAYFCVIFLFNFVMFIVVLVQLCRIKRQNPHNVRRSLLQEMRSVAGITVLLGLTWGFAFFAWGPVNLPFMYLFAIFNSLQGFFIFVFYCVAKDNVRKQWRTYLCCGRMRLAENSEWSRTATQKTVKKSSMNRMTSLHSSKSSKFNNSTSSCTYLVSDSPEPMNGIGGTFEENAITADEEPGTDVILNEINRQYRTRPAP